MRKKLLLLALACTLCAWAQTESTPPPDSLLSGGLPPSWRQPVPEEYPTLKKFTRPFSHAFNHLDLSLTTGTTGLGFDVSMPINDMFSLRAGYAAMPHFTQKLSIGIWVGDDLNLSQSKFARLSSLLEDFMGSPIDDRVIMDANPTFWNWKMLVDVKPLRNKNWHFTAGVFWGSSFIFEAVNSKEDMASLMAVSIYNRVYYNALMGLPLVNAGSYSFDNEEVRNSFVRYGLMSLYMGTYKNDMYYEEDEYWEMDYWDQERDIFYNQGDIKHHKGDLKAEAGSMYHMVPDENSLVKAYAYANRFKPYLGFGYGGRITKGDDLWHVSFDAGVLFWGGSPRVLTHDGTDMVNELGHIPGKVGEYVNFIKKFKVFPVLNLRITRRIF